jgi:hypothetical protein
MGFVRVGVSFILGALLAGYYIIPVALFSGNGIEPPSSPSLTAFFTPLLTLLSPVLISQNPSQIETFTIHFYPAVGWVFILSFFCMLYYLTQGKKSQTTEVDENNRGLITILLVLFAVSFFLTWSPLDFWKYIPGSNFVQHSYRFLIHTSWIGALLFGFSLQYLFREFENKHILVGIFLLVLACVTYLPSTSQASSITLQDIKDKPILSTMDYLYYPELAKPDNNHAALSGKSIMIPNDETGLVRSKGRMVGDIQVPAGIDYIQLPILYYPNLMEINANGQVIDYYPVYNKDLPFYLIKGHVWLTGIKLSPGNYHITVDFNGIQWANTASVISWIFLFAGLVIICLFRLRNQHPDWV